MIFGNPFFMRKRRNSNDFKPYGSDAKSLQKSKNQQNVYLNVSHKNIGVWSK